LFTVANVGFLPNNNPVKRKVCTKFSFFFPPTQQHSSSWHADPPAVRTAVPIAWQEGSRSNPSASSQHLADNTRVAMSVLFGQPAQMTGPWPTTGPVGAYHTNES